MQSKIQSEILLLSISFITPCFLYRSILIVNFIAYCFLLYVTHQKSFKLTRMNSTQSRRQLGKSMILPLIISFIALNLIQAKHLLIETVLFVWGSVLWRQLRSRTDVQWRGRISADCHSEGSQRNLQSSEYNCQNIARGTTDPWVDTITGGTL